MRNQPNVVLVLALILFFPMAICAPIAAAQDNVMEFVIAYPQDMGELNPLYGKSSRTWWYDMLVYDTLLSYDENLTAIPWLAENYSVSEDGLPVSRVEPIQARTVQDNLRRIIAEKELVHQIVFL